MAVLQKYANSQCLLEQKHWLMQTTVNAARVNLSNVRHGCDVQLPKPFYSDYIISVFRYTTRYSLFIYDLDELFDCSRTRRYYVIEVKNSIVREIRHICHSILVDIYFP